MSAGPVAPHAVVEITVEIPRGGVVKRREDGKVDFVSPVPCPFNYGSVPETRSGDGDRLDAIVLGPRLTRGRVVLRRTFGVVRFRDSGLDDPKLICALSPPSEAQWRAVAAFFRIYEVFKRGLHRFRGASGPTRYEGIERWAAPPRGGGSA